MALAVCEEHRLPRRRTPSQAGEAATEDAYPGLNGPLHDLRLQVRHLLLARLAEASGEEVDRVDPLGDAVVDEGRDDAGGDAGDDVVDGAFDVEEAGVALEPLDLLVVWVDGVDGGAAHLLEGHDEAGTHAAEAGLGRRGAGDCDGAGVEDEVESLSCPLCGLP